MADQLDLFDSAPEPQHSTRALPEGFKFQPDVISAETEAALLSEIRTLPFQAFEFHGFVGNRRTVSFGAAYDFATERLLSAAPIPEFLLRLRDTAAAFADVPATDLVQVLVSEYAPDAGIGWHRDKRVFGDVIGISLLSACKFRLRRNVGGAWQRVTLDATPRSAYLLHGPSRTEWEHSVPPVSATRYSVTYRTLKERAGG